MREGLGSTLDVEGDRMPDIHVEIHNEDRPDLDAFLGDRLYEFNSTATGIYDGELLNASSKMRQVISWRP